MALGAYQQFFDFLPGPLSGLGVQARYTYVDSSVTNRFATAGSNIPTMVPLRKLSKHSYNLNTHLAVSLDAVNLTYRMNLTYIGTMSQPLQYTLNDRRFGFSLRATY